MEGNEKPAFRVGKVFYSVGKNDRGEVVGTVQADDIRKATTFTEQAASDKLFKLYTSRQQAKKSATDWFLIYADTNTIKNTKRMLRLIQNEKKQAGIPLDTPEVS